MQITLNGQAYSCSAALTISALLDELGFTGQRLAVEVNQAIVPKSQHATYQLQAEDSVEIVHAIGGG